MQRLARAIARLICRSLGAPKFSIKNIDEYIEWVHAIISKDLPNPVSDAGRYELVKTYQVHHYSKSCKKYKSDKCRFYFGPFFPDRTIIACLLSADLTASQRKDILKKRNGF